MRIVVIGAVAAGTSVAAKIRRNDEECEIVVYEKGKYISYSSCGMPYLIGRDDVEADALIPRDPAWFKKRFAFDIRTGHEVLEADPEERILRVKNLETGEIFEDRYDELVLATGSRAVIPPVEGVKADHVFPLKTMEDSLALEVFLKKKTVKKAVVIGSGFIGLELYENLTGKGIETVLIEAKKSLLPILDEDISLWLRDYMEKKNLPYILDDIVVKIEKDKVVTRRGKEVDAELVIMAAGVRPETGLAEQMGMKLGESGAILTDSKLNTSIPHIKAVGDCAEVWSVADGTAMYRPMGSTANRTGRIAGILLSGGNAEFRGVLGTGILRFFDLEIGFTGRAERDCVPQEIEVVHNIKENQSRYLSESREMVIKALADRETGKLLGVQIIGERGVDKRLDVFATAITFGASVDDLFHLDLSYAPPFSTTKDPVMYTGMILSNAINEGRAIMTPSRLIGHEEEYQILDVRSNSDYEKGHIETARNIPLGELRDRLEELDRTKPVITHCNKGVTGNAAQNLLINAGFKEVYNLSGGYKNYAVCRKYPS
jgi:NADPH-dependent 2,4-dienoyl-CoA reductase/sulfur reductase-like enzyme/rhodanese-related sulfurtransferase